MLVVVAGLIGAGKSTLVHNLASKNGYTEFQEPVDSNPFLVSYYKDPSRWSFALQVFYLWERYKQMQEAFMRSLHGEIVILDSSIYSDLAFAIVQAQEHYFTPEEYKTYLNMYNIIITQLAYPDVFVWLDLPVDETMKRINNRSRDCESNIPKEYLINLNNAYNHVIDKLKKRTNVFSVDATPNADEVYYKVNELISNYKNTGCDNTFYEYNNLL